MVSERGKEIEGLYSFKYFSELATESCSLSDGLVRMLEERGKGWGSVLREMGEAGLRKDTDTRDWILVNL